MCLLSRHFVSLSLCLFASVVMVHPKLFETTDPFYPFILSASVTSWILGILFYLHSAESVGVERLSNDFLLVNMPKTSHIYVTFTSVYSKKAHRSVHMCERLIATLSTAMRSKQRILNC